MSEFPFHLVNIPSEEEMNLLYEYLEKNNYKVYKYDFLEGYSNVFKLNYDKHIAYKATGLFIIGEYYTKHGVKYFESVKEYIERNIQEFK